MNVPFNFDKCLFRLNNPWLTPKYWRVSLKMVYAADANKAVI